MRILRRVLRFFVRDVPDWRSGTTVVILLVICALLTAQVEAQGALIVRQKETIDLLLHILFGG